MRQLGARAFDLDIDTGTGILLPPVGEPLHADRLDQAVKEAGFELLGLELEVRGRLGRARSPDGEDVPAVEVDSTGQSFVILEGDSEREHEAWARLSPSLERSGASISIRGRVHRHAGGPTVLFVNDFRMLDG